MIFKIGRKKYDALGEYIEEWCEEQGFTTDSLADCALINSFLKELGIEYDRRIE